MNWGELKKKIDSLSKEELKKDVILIATDRSFSGKVNKVSKCRSDLYYRYDDDPAYLETKKELKEAGFINSDIEEMEVYVSRGELFLEFPN